MNDTICAIATSSGTGAISIIKVSGIEAIKIVDSIFSGDLKKAKTRSLNYGFIIDKKEKIDEVLVSVMHAPKTFTTEDIVEINCHGGIAVTNKILELLLTKGCRLAEPGEFTKRAYLNGRIDLIEAEAISDLIAAETEKSSSLAINQVDGKLSKKIQELRDDLLYIQANIEVNIDYPEYEDIEVLTNETLLPKINKVKKKMEKMLEQSEDGKLIRNGINIAIIGKPNVGKSSILNFFLNENRAIVTDIAGTTRDIVEGKVILNGIVVNFIDTAGIHDTEDQIEKIGINKSIESIKNSDLIIFVLDNSAILSIDDLEILEMLKEKKFILFINKSDLAKKINNDVISKYDIVEGNTIEEHGLDALKEKIIELFNLEKISNKDLNYLSNSRQIALMKQASNSLDAGIESLKSGLPVDVVGIDLHKSWSLLGEIIGESYEQELLDKLFSNFCLGK